MPIKTTFTHLDGRTFNYKETSPHTTRDGRQITLKAWVTSCSHRGCLIPLEVRTATDNPWEWAKFAPPKFCTFHRLKAQTASYKKLVKARAEGLRRWLDSPEGKAAMAQRERDRKGKVEQVIYGVVSDFSLAGDVMLKDVVDEAIARLLPPLEPGKRDTRHFRVDRAMISLQEKGWLSLRRGVVTLLR
jgi:hypothetical protein